MNSDFWTAQIKLINYYDRDYKVIDLYAHIKIFQIQGACMF